MDAKTLQLLNDLIEDRLDAERATALGELLRADPEVEQEYLRLLRLHLNLVDSEAPVRPFSLEELRAVQAVDERFGDRGDAGLAERAAATPPVATPASAVPGTAHRDTWLRFGIAAALLATAATVLIVLAIGSSRPGPGPEVAALTPLQPAEAPRTSGIVARIIKKVDCDWEDDRWSVAPSASILAGQQINLSRGLLVLQFSSGAEITLDGPATFVATSDMSAELLQGKLSARVPPQAHGFKVETHAGDFIDLGTEFGMIVTSDGAVQTHVFKGKVIADPVLHNQDAPEGIVLKSGTAWGRPASGGASKSLTAQPELFMLPNIADESARPAPPPVERNLVLWFDAASRIQRDENGNVSAWGDIVTPTNVQAEDAWQVTATQRPTWVADGFGGRPSLRFDGYKSLVTEPIHLGSNQTSAVVFRVDSEAARDLVLKRTQYQYLGIQLLNLNGPPHTVMQLNADARVEARVHLGFLRNQPKPVDVGLTRSEDPVDGGAHIALYSYDAATSTARLCIDGRVISTSMNAPQVSDTNSPRFLGSHFEREGFGFTGDIAEILVFDTGLTEDEALTLSDWLAEKYGITVPSRQVSDVVR